MKTNVNFNSLINSEIKKDGRIKKRNEKVEDYSLILLLI